MIVTCPKCETKARVASSRVMTKEIREAYCQCLNLNCGAIFVAQLVATRIITPTGEKPSPEMQPELFRTTRNRKSNRTPVHP